MQSVSRLLLLLGAPWYLAVSPSSTARESAARKCSMPVSKEPQYFIDGRTSDLAALKLVAEAEIIGVMVLCLNPVDHTVIRPGTQSPGMPAIAVWTAKGPSAQLEPLLKKVNDAQRAHFAATGEYATTLTALPLGPISSDVRLTLDATTTRWRAYAEVVLPTSPRCTVFDGALDAPLPGPKGVVRCSDPA